MDESESRPRVAFPPRPSSSGGPLRPALTVVCLFISLLFAGEAGAATELYVNKDSPNRSDNCATHGSTSKPLATVAHAVDVCAPAAADDVTVTVLCTVPSGVCDYDLPSGQTFKALPGNRRATIRGEPYQMVRFRQAFNGDSSKAVHVESQWTLSGLVFDGMRETVTPEPPNTGGGFVRLIGDNISFEHNEVHNTPYICLTMASGGPVMADQRMNIEISHNRIHDCHTAQGPSSAEASKDRHCIYNRIARSVVISFNDIYECGGDGYAIENYLVQNSVGEVPQLAEVALDNRIVGNRFYTSCTGGVSWGENAIDVKRAGAGLVIRDNAMWGYRQANDKTIPCHGTGSGDPGYAIVVHGQLETANGIESATGPLQNGPPCTGVPRCAIIEGNDISNTQAGIGLGTSGAYPLEAQGRTYGVDVRGNVIHDLRGIGQVQGQAARRGYGIALETPAAGVVGPEQFNRIYRNALAHLPGNSFTLGAVSSQFSVRNNLVSWTGLGAPCAAALGALPDDHRDNYWNDALTPLSTAAHPEFALTGQQPFRAPSTPTGQVSCGSVPPLPETPEPYLGLPYDYRITGPPPLTDSGGTDPAFGEPYTGDTELCGAAYDIGPSERCGDDKKVYLREKGGSDPDRDEEISAGLWWLSPDIGLWEDDGVTPYIPVPGDAPLREDTPYFSKNATTNAKLLVRIRADNAPPPTEPIHVRIWGAPMHTSLSFPRAFTKYVDEDVNWSASSPRLVDSGPGWRVYAFPWRVKGARHPQYAGKEHFCLRAEISTRFDRKPPFMAPIWRSNNLAQRNVSIEREPVSSPNFLFSIEDQNKPLIVTTRLARGRQAYLHFPESPTRLWTPRRTRLVTPGKRSVPLRRGRMVLRPRPSRAGVGIAQIVVDSHDAGVPSPSEYIAVRQAQRSGIRIKLNRPGFRESFEWGIPTRWRATGAWRAVDRDRHRCGISRLGVRAAGFTSIEGCRVTVRRRRGSLVSPAFRVRTRRGPVGITFFHFARMRGGFTREVWVSTSSGKRRVRRWRRKTHGRADRWQAEYLDLSGYRGQRVRLRFRVRAQSGTPATGRPAGWFIDDIAAH